MSLVPTKTSQMWFCTLFATFQLCPLCLKTLVLGIVLGHLSGVPSEVNKRTPPKHTPEGVYGHLGGPTRDFGAPRGVPFGGKILQNGILEDMSCSLECQGGSEMAPRGPKVPQLTYNCILNLRFSMHIVGILCCDLLLSGHTCVLSWACFPSGLAQRCLFGKSITVIVAAFYKCKGRL